jgi:methionyl-tRNA synthetase
MLEVLYVLLESIRYIAIYLQPFMPDSASRMLDQLGVEANRRDFSSLDTRLEAGILLPAPIALFPRILDE